jgi:RibD C-terminal domain
MSRVCFRPVCAVILGPFRVGHSYGAASAAHICDESRRQEVTRGLYVASTTVTQPQWANTTVLSGELANDLVDQMDLVIFPVVVGQGTRLFPDSGPDRALELVESQATSRGVTIQVYRPAGRLQFGTSTADLRHMGPSD